MRRLAFFIKQLASEYATGMITIVAGAMLMLILASTAAIWPISFLGYRLDAESHTIRHLDPYGAAAKAGLKIGDTIITLYDRPITVVLHSLLFRFVGKPGGVAPIIVQRGGQLITV